jgi:DNA processing protein
VTHADRDEARAATVALVRETGLDAPGLADRLERQDPSQVLAEQLGVGSSLLPEDPEPRLVRARQQIAVWERHGLRLLTLGDPDYPAALHMVHDRPALLWVDGDTDLVGDTRAIAVVGTRHPSDDGQAHARAIATDLAQAGFTVLSGLAAGIDTVAHQSALAAGGRTIAVVGTGLDHSYPPQNAPLQAELARHNAVVSPFWPQDGPSPERFRRRNAVMSGLALGTVIVEASLRSGTRVQARLALAHGRPVFLRRTLLAQSWAVELSHRPGVHVIDTAADVLEIVRQALDRGPIIDDRSGQGGRPEPPPRTA